MGHPAPNGRNTCLIEALNRSTHQSGVKMVFLVLTWEISRQFRMRILSDVLRRGHITECGSHEENKRNEETPYNDLGGCETLW